MDWGCVSQLNVAMAIWGAMSAAEIDLWDHHFDEFLDLFCDEVHASGGPELDPAHWTSSDALRAADGRHLADGCARADPVTKVPDSGPAIRRTDPAIKGDESVRAPLQMLTNVLNLWEHTDMGEVLRGL